MNLRQKNIKLKVIISILLIMVISIGYAILSQTVNITGVSKIQNPTWDIHFDNIEVNEGSVSVNTENGEKPATIDNPTKVSYTVTLNKPGDFYDFNVDVVNEGTMKAMVNTAVSKLKIGDEEKDIDELPSWLKYNVSYLDGSQIEQGHLLLPDHYETYHVRLEFSKEVNEEDLPDEELSLTLDFEVEYVQESEIDSIDQYTIHYNGNGNTSGSMEDSTCEIEENCTLRQNRYLKEGYLFRGWSKSANGEVLYTDASTLTDITTRNSITLYAIWEECSGLDCHIPDTFTITFDYDGGVGTEITRTVFEGEKIGDLPETSKDNNIFTGWVDEDNLVVTKDTIVNKNMTIKAVWSKIVGRIGNKKYSSITSALEEAQSGDVIELLCDNEENIVNDKNVTIDLGGNKITGSIINNSEGVLTLINGTIENPNGIAITNNGELTLGVDDYKSTEEVNIENNLSIIGKEVGIKQNNILHYYDGIIEGEVALDGGYDSSPFYRNTFDGEVVYYFPFVDYDNQKECQHVELESSDQAVTKTSVHGDIYYYNLQDNINASAKTGYTIYAVRDFNASYDITIEEDMNVTFDINGYSPTLAGDLENNGVFNITDSSEEKGILKSTKTIVNNNKLNLTNVTLKEIGNSHFIHNKSELKMINSTIASTNSYAYYSVYNGATINMDDDSYITTDSTSFASIYNTANDFVINGGNIFGNYRAIYAHGGVTTINGGTINCESNTTNNTTVYADNNSKLIINDGNIKSESSSIAVTTILSTDSSTEVIINGGSIIAITNAPEGNTNGNKDRVSYALNITGDSKLTLNGGNIKSTGTSLGGKKIAIRIAGTGTSTIKGGIVEVTNEEVEGIGATSYSSIVGIIMDSYYYYYNYPTVKIEGGIINAKGKNTAYGINGGSIDYGSLRVSGGTINIESKTGYGINGGKNTITGGKIEINSTTGYGISGGKNNISDVEIEVNSTTGYGINGGTNTITGGKIEVTSTTGYGINGGTNTITGGKIKGSTYGIYNGTNTLGSNDGSISITNPEIVGGSYGIYGGSTHFYDGVLKGKTASYQSGTIKTIPDGVVYHSEVMDEYENTWLEVGTKYLEVNGIQYSSMTEAYNALPEEGGTIKVIDSIVSMSVLPEFKDNKNVIFDLNGKSLTYVQPLINASGSLTIVDNSANKNGSINNTGTDVSAIKNTSGQLTIESGNINGLFRSIEITDGTLTINGGNIKSESTTIATETILSTGSSTKVIINGGSIIAITNAPEGNTNGNKDRVSYALNITGDSKLTLNGGNIKSTGTSLGGKKIAIRIAGTGTSTIKGGIVEVTNEEVEGIGATSYSSIVGIIMDSYYYYYNYPTVKIEGGIINAKGKNTAYGINGGSIDYGSLRVSGGTINIESKTGYGINGGKNTITGGKIEINSTTGYGISGGKNNISDVEIEVNSTTGYGINGGTNNITGGKISATTYGIYNGTNTLGSDDGEVSITNPEIVGGSYGLYGGTTNFYDGVLKGKTGAYQSGVIVAIPDGTIYHNEIINEYDNCWLEEGTKYLEVNGTQYSSMTKAYKAIPEEGGTIKVIASIVSSSVLPEFRDNKDVILDLNGNSLTYEQSLINASGSLKIIDDSENKNGSINNTNTGVATIKNTGGQLTIEEGNINGIYRGIEITSGKLTVNGGTIKSESSTTTNEAILSTGSGTEVIINGGSITAITNAPEGSPNGNSNKTTYALNITAHSKLKLNGGNIKATGTSLGGKKIAIRITGTGESIITGGQIEATNEDVTGIGTSSYSNVVGLLMDNYDWYYMYPTVKIEGGTIEVNGQNIGYGITGGSVDYGQMTINGGTINVEATTGYGINGGKNIINGGTINVEATTGYGINGGKNTIKDIGIEVNTTTTGYGINGGTNNITGGKISATTYGIYNGTNTLGSNDGEVSITNPEIVGDSYGIYGGSTNFYDGVLKGRTAAYTENNIVNIAENFRIFEEIKQINDEDYFADYLVEQTDVAEINGNRYTNLNDAISNCEDGAVITIIDDIYNTDNITIPVDKSVEIDFGNYSFNSSKKIVNNGNLTISGNDNLSYFGTDYLITNNSGSTLTINNVKLDSAYVIDNKAGATLNTSNTTITSTKVGINNLGTWTGNGDSITSSENAINNQGSFELTNMTIKGTSYGINDNGTSESTISNSTITSSSNAIYKNSTSTTNLDNVVINGHVCNNNTNGVLNITNNSSISRSTSGGGITNFINKGFAVVDHSNINLNVFNNNNSETSDYGINNTGTLSIKNNSLIKVLLEDSVTRHHVHGVYNTNMLTFEDSDILVDGNKYSNSYNNYGIYNNSGTSVVTSGNIKVLGRNTYGIYHKSGTVNLGVAEENTSPGYGRDTADVSITNPLIESLGTNNGIGVKNINGTFKYYDGKIVATTSPLPEVPTGVEYLYEAKEFVDDLGRKYCILKWMRETS